MFSALNTPRAAAQRLLPLLPMLRVPPLGPVRQPAAVPPTAGLRLPAEDPLRGGWHDSSLDLQRGLLVQDLYVEAPNTDWLALFDEDDLPKR
ncbi:MAG TPA: hypothetical protein VLA61_08055 [Ideonella sp.]|uniref:hypothetical protein n=1 Tax=Ideonella sp. TaxID=1929293 RepID=UPI002C71F5C5|nr:hypothetical protein [Ideonella sp.]HSI48206.1 hypothetical protein [Ideonella sp.]